MPRSKNRRHRRALGSGRRGTVRQAFVAWREAGRAGDTSGGRRISRTDSGVSSPVIPTNEELMIAQHTLALIRPSLR